MLIFAAIAAAVIALAHMVPAPFVLEWMAGDRAVWRMPAGAVPTVYLTYDDGPNPSTTPDLLDVLAREGVHATFFLIDEHITGDTAPIVRRIAREGHAIGLHTSTRRFMLMTPRSLAADVARGRRSDRGFGWPRPCRAFRPHAGWRGGQMYEGLRAKWTISSSGGAGCCGISTGSRRAMEHATFRGVAPRVSDGDIVVMHDGDESAPTRDQRHTVEATGRLIPELRARGFSFGRVCEPWTTNREPEP